MENQELKEGTSYGDSRSFQNKHELEEIISHKTENNIRCFGVKLKNVDQFVWVPLTSHRILNENAIMKYYYHHNIRIDDLPPISRVKRAKDLFELLSKVSDDQLNMFVRKFDNFVLPPSNMSALMHHLTQLIPADDQIRLNDSQIAYLRDKVLLEVCHLKRQQQLQRLQEKEWLFNKVSDNTEPIWIQNNVDFATVPDFVKYVNQYVPGQGVRIPLLPPDDFGCGAYPSQNKKHTCSRRCICMTIFEAKPAYDKNGQVIQRRGERIHECNKKCRCDESCLFRVIQKGCKIPLLIFRCSNGAGWGVKTLQFIPKGTFIGKYVGKVVFWEEAELLTTTEGRNHYLFDIDYITDENGRSKYTVDAYEYGNFTRFINHSCSPNLIVHHVWVNTLDDHLHDIAFFAIRPIEYGEELTFNYRKVVEHCKCGSFKCIQTRG